MGGKRQANVLSALIQNFDTVEKVIETSANSAGSALKENERYLDSIQGKIDQFNNALQSMWSNFLSDDFIKFIVEFGTELIKAADKIGLFGTLIVVLTGSKLIPWILNSITGMSTFGESLKYVGMMMTSVNGTGAALTTTIITQTKALWGASVAGNVFTKSIKTLGIAFKALMATPLGWLLAIGAVVALVVHLFDVFTTTTAELKEELSDLQSELKDIRSNLEAVNSELETTNERMAELLAKDQLSFVEEEELKALKKRNEELQREIDLLELKEKQTKKDTANKFVETIESDVNASGGFTNEYTRENDKIRKVKWYDWITNFSEMFNPIDSKATEDDYIQQQVARYRELQKEIEAKEKEILGVNGDDNKSKKKREKLEKQKNKLTNEEQAIESYINSKTTEWNEFSEELDYGISTETDAWLDYINNMQDKWAIASDGKNAKTNAINRILNKDQYASVSESIDGYVEALKNGDTSAKTSIENIIKNNKDLANNLIDAGVSIEDAVDHFTLFSSGIGNTIEEVTGQYQKGIGALGKYHGAATDIIAEFKNENGLIEQISWGSLFDDNGNTIDTQISKVLQGADETARKEFARIAKAVNEGKMSVDNAMKSFSISGAQSGYKLLEASVVEINGKIFKDLEDDISGLIDTFTEFGSALESVAKSIELVTQAEAEMAYSGHLSVETALQLINSTENWNDVLKVENGNITLVDGAMDILAQSKLNQIKTNLQLALSEAKAGLEQARLAESSGEVAKTLEESTTESVRQLAANMEYLSTLVGEFLAGHFLSAGSSARAAKEDSLKATAYQKSSTSSSMSVSDWEDKVSDIEAKLGILESVDTPSEFQSNYSSDEVSGGNKTKDEVEDDAFQREMDYWENRIAANQAKYGQLQNEIDLLESRGQKAGAEYYKEQMKLEEGRLRLLNQQKMAAKSHLSALKEGSDEWWEVANVLNGIQDDLDDVTASIVDLQDAIGDIETYKFEEFNTRLDNLAGKLGTIRDLIAPDGEEDWFDEEGGWTEKGVAALGTYTQELEFFKHGYQNTVDEIAKYQSEYAGNEDYYETLGIHSEQELYDKQQDLIDQQYDYAESISNSEQSIVDMYESGIDATEEYFDTLVDSYNDYIDSVKDALDAERDLYDFKKNVQKQSKDIASLERRIASLSGSTNASDIAERRKLEAELYDSRESLNDTYYDHAKQSQQDALDSEAKAYEDTMTKMVEGMRTSLEQATLDMDTFLGNVTTMVARNAGVILTEYRNTGVELDPALTTPWENAKNAVGDYSGDALDLMNKWTQGGFFTTFPNAVGNSLSSPWGVGTKAVDAFTNSVEKAMSDVVEQIESNISVAKGNLDSLYKQIIKTEERAAHIPVDPPEPPKPQKELPEPPASTTYTMTASGKNSSSIRMGTKQDAEKKIVKVNSAEYVLWTDGYYYPASKLRVVTTDVDERGKKTSVWGIPAGTTRYKRQTGGGGSGKGVVNSAYAKGTVGTTRDEWAITDEPQFGDELVLVPGKNGNLSFMRRGTGVVPADLTQKLFELAQIPTSDLMNKSLSAIVPNMTKNDFKNEFNFESLVHVDTVDSDTLPKLEKMVDKKIDDFSRALNYSLKKFAR